MKIKYFLLLSLFLFSACSSMSDAKKVLKNEKVRTTDEFLVKKRNPLVLPPNYEEIPKPGTKSNNQDNEEEKIKKILKVPKTEGTTNSNSKSVEESILKRIRK